jgi:hypothetical protein
MTPRIPVKWLFVLSGASGIPAVPFLLRGIPHGLGMALWPLILFVWPAVTLALVVVLMLSIHRIVRVRALRTTVNLGAIAVSLASCVAVILAWLT